MKRTLYLRLLPAAAAVLAVGFLPGCERGGKGSVPGKGAAAGKGPGPNVGSAPDRGPGPETGMDIPLPAISKTGWADNSYCLVCHGNYKSEWLAMYHQCADVGCSTCHGESDNHSSDENGITPPDVMYPRERVRALCMQCHRVQELVEKGMHRDALSRLPPAGHVCTECHGEHRLKVRTRQWDKLTGKLIADDGVRMVDVNQGANRPGN